MNSFSRSQTLKVEIESEIEIAFKFEPDIKTEFDIGMEIDIVGRKGDQK